MRASHYGRTDPLAQFLIALMAALRGLPTLPSVSPRAAATGLRQRLDLLAVMVTVITAGVTGYVGINIMSETQSTTNLTSGDTFFNAQENLTDGLENFFSQLGTVFTVIILVVVIGYLMLLRGR